MKSPFAGGFFMFGRTAGGGGKILDKIKNKLGEDEKEARRKAALHLAYHARAGLGRE
jgi:hypothetical protein